MNVEFAKTIAKRFYWGHDSNAQIAQDLSINKNTVARIRKVCKDLKWVDDLSEKRIARCAQEHHVSKSVIRAIYPVARDHRYR